ncbi:YjzD family protein [Enterococcus cecorum]|uniref:DUF2929 domain-containing protein n=1 Tax=Enterococcus cecorum TaxID=44008 RepID=A0A1Y4R0N9_9ENTE|nr:YjzD family protein [Enterococcus cecorum]MDZ5440746.1 YjzD family protein [Enterococcus cecorum]MDZ5498784.1 YjzD family protein [Enterococcus cecorum]MDZ5561722.1 YjzD family protein [Enterococcus cecorum]MDZ5576273.1 YjzD family protein [Enterococcus cecorum]MDZ5588418.1 YjzD family protein [Enterococcus cecorum]
MKYIVTMFWAMILGQVVGYLGSALTGGQYDFTVTAQLSFLVGIIVIIIANVCVPKKAKQN